MIEPVSGTGRSITTDNWFTSIPLAETLLNDLKLTLVGTLRKNNKEIPPTLISKGNPINSSIFAFKESMTMVVYTPKRNKVVTLISTMLDNDEIDPESGDSCKPYIVTFYNSTKCGEDLVDQYKERYSVSRTSNRWSLTLFFTLLNVTGLNSYIVFKHGTGKFDIPRQHFLKELSKNLCARYLQERSAIKTLPVGLKRNIRQMLGMPEDVEVVPASASPDVERPGQCAFCDWRKKERLKPSAINVSDTYARNTQQ